MNGNPSKRVTSGNIKRVSARLLLGAEATEDGVILASPEELFAALDLVPLHAHLNPEAMVIAASESASGSERAR